MSRLSDQVAIVTGASQGIGSGIATAAIGSAANFLTTEVLMALRSRPCSNRSRRDFTSEELEMRCLHGQDFERVEE
jgi:NAD(P)-dependent dehydrogenase (short-subunit alcohol dehydrogenase family)